MASLKSPAITNLTDTQLLELVLSFGVPGYRAKQLQHWIYRGLAESFEEMSNLPQAFRHRLARELQLSSLTPVHEVAGSDDGTVKTVFRLPDGKTIESTLMAYLQVSGRSRHTICLSTQVGCPIGCPFCTTGRQGFERNLTSGEIVDQVLYFARWLKHRGDRKSDDSHQPVGPVPNLVFMGMGEPLANYDAVCQAIETLNSPDGFALGTRNMVISTAGIVPRIRQLGEQKLQVGLAVSLHASDNGLRNKLVPLNRKYPLEELIPACREYSETTKRRISFEYVLCKGVNDSIAHASSLARLLAGLNCHVNLIPVNHIADVPNFEPPPGNTILAFQKELKRQDIVCTLRRSMGVDINAGCGQLRSRLIASSSPVTGGLIP